MGIGFRELLVILGMLAIVVLMLVGLVWLIGTASKSSKVTPRSASERLAELESLRKADQITAAEYEKQRAAIVASV
jgi:Na+-transporting methylmalonyl-CoA/oxaloacetate decarboxylase gamma subunit